MKVLTKFGNNPSENLDCKQLDIENKIFLIYFWEFSLKSKNILHFPYNQTYVK